MKLSLFTASLLLTASLYASTHHMSPTQEGVHAVQLLDRTLQTNLMQKLKEDHEGTAAIDICTEEADRTMQEIKETRLPGHVKMRIASIDSNNTQLHPTDLKIMKKYQNDIEKKTEGAMMITTAKVGENVHVYKPFVIDNVWIECLDTNSTAKLGEFKGVIISEVSKH